MAGGIILSSFCRVQIPGIQFPNNYPKSVSSRDLGSFEKSIEGKPISKKCAVWCSYLSVLELISLRLLPQPSRTDIPRMAEQDKIFSWFRIFDYLGSHRENDKKSIKMALSNAARPNLAYLFSQSWGPGMPNIFERHPIAKRKIEKYDQKKSLRFLLGKTSETRFPVNPFVRLRFRPRQSFFEKKVVDIFAWKNERNSISGKSFRNITFQAITALF